MTICPSVSRRQSSHFFTIQPRFSGEKLRIIPSPREACRKASRQTFRLHCVPLHARCCCHPRKQQTSTWEQSRASQPAPPPPTEAEVTTEEVQKGERAVKEVSKPWSRDLQATIREGGGFPISRGASKEGHGVTLGLRQPCNISERFNYTSGLS